MGRYFIGVDLGQSQDFTTIAVVERVDLRGEWDPAMFARRDLVVLRLRLLERIRLGTPYPQIVERVVEVACSPELAGQSHLAVDATGVGRPVLDMLRRSRPPSILMPVIVTGGERETHENGCHRVPKRDLIIGLQVVLQREALQIAAGLAHAPALVAEMAEMQVKITPAGHEQYGAWRQGTHDDLVFAVALACWSAHKIHPHPPAGEERWLRYPYRAEPARLL
jgi:hypothetical protein